MEACNNNPPPPLVTASDPTPPVTTITADSTVPPPPIVIVRCALRGKKGGQGRNKKGGGRTGGHPLGACNYCNDILIIIVDACRPTGKEGWKVVAIEYQQTSQEETLCAAQDIREHWTKKLCNN